MIQCLVVDDEALARKLLADYIGKIPDLELVATCENPIQAKKILSTETIDLLFLDIQMPGITGVEFLRTLKDKPLTIFTTAYSEYALEGYSLDVIDYLLKPIPFERFFQAVSKAQDYLSYRKPEARKQADEKPEKQQYIFVKADYKIIKIRYEDILYIEGMKEYVRIHTTDRIITTYQSLQKLTEMLPAGIFVRVHKSFIVNMDKIDSIDNTVIIIEDEVIGIGRSYRDEFFRRIKNRMIN